MTKVTLRKITNLKKARTIASRYPKSIVKVSYAIMIMVFISLAGLGIAQLYGQELEEKQQDINVKAVDVDALLKTTLNNAIVLRSQAEYLGNQGQSEMSLSLAPLLPTIYKQLPTEARIYYTSIAGTLDVIYPAIPPMTRKENVETFQKAIHQEFITSGIKNNPSRKAYFTNPYQDILGKKLIVTASSPVYQGNNHLGNIGIDFPLESLNRFVKKLGGRSAMILTSEGKVLSHPNLQPRYLKPAEYFISDFSVRAKLLKLLKTGNKGQITINGYLITYQKLNNAPWMIVNITHRKILVKDIIKKQLPIILGVILGMTIVLLISLRIINQVFTQCQKARMVAELANEKLQKALTELERIASTDTLTGAWNRLYFEEIVSGEIERLLRHNQLLSLLILDIDHFKSINDNYGHPIGDCVLAGLAHLLKENIRTSDVLTRWGGEEFVILTPSTSIAEAYELAERLRLVIAKHSFPEVRNITASFGIAQFETAETLYSCFKRADDALYHAKKSGRNTVVAAPSIRSVYQLKQLAG
ncbi:hypothetical protein NIES2101_12535 [Calothrix sp. HK-06]|nr:hypothetical protein NIES2101_12535 [Calothrix sp. HK-06]